MNNERKENEVVIIVENKDTLKISAGSLKRRTKRRIQVQQKIILLLSFLSSI